VWLVWYGYEPSAHEPLQTLLAWELVKQGRVQRGFSQGLVGITVVVGSKNGFLIVFVLNTGFSVAFVLDIGFSMDFVLSRGVFMVFVLNGGFSVGFVFAVRRFRASTPTRFSQQWLLQWLLHCLRTQRWLLHWLWAMVGYILASTVAGFCEMLQDLYDNLHQIDRNCSNNVHSS